MTMLATGEQPYFPVYAEMPETKRHLEQRTLLYQVLKLAFGDRAAVGCDQFVYWEPTDPRVCLAPDAFVCLGEVNDLFPSWKVWERAVPQVAVEIVSESDERARGWDAKLERYRRLGVTELVRFDSVATEQPLRIWERVADVLLERELTQPRAASRVLPGFWLAIEQPGMGLVLRLSHEEQGARLFLTEAEQQRAGAETSLAEADRRIRELEAELRRRS
jgi:Uma2 family endonuclease